MPTYEYECRECHCTFEQFQQMSDEPVKVCPKCGGKVRRLIGGGTGIIFKGSGFYITDSKKSGSASTPAKSASPLTGAEGVMLGIGLVGGWLPTAVTERVAVAV